MNLKPYEKKEKRMPHIDKMIEMASGKRNRYKRMGKCVRCGLCCLNENCEHFSILDNGKAYCSIHKSKNRELKCKIYPESPPLQFETCGYYFKDLATGRIIRHGVRL